MQHNTLQGYIKSSKSNLYVNSSKIRLFIIIISIFYSSKSNGR